MYKPSADHEWRQKGKFATAERRAESEDYVPTLSDRILGQADEFGVAQAAAVDDSQPYGSGPLDYGYGDSDTNNDC